MAKAEHNALGANPRFVVSSFGAGEMDCEELHEGFHCARGDMENRIEEQQLDMFADRTSTARMHANQLRLYFASFAYVPMETLRRVGLAGTELAKAQCGTIRDKVLEVGAQVRVSVRRVRLSFDATWPRAALLRAVLANLAAMPLRCRTPAGRDGRRRHAGGPRLPARPAAPRKTRCGHAFAKPGPPGTCRNRPPNVARAPGRRRRMRRVPRAGRIHSGEKCGLGGHP